MVLGLKFHCHTHQISSIQFTNPVHQPQTIPKPLFQVQPIQTRSFSPLQLNGLKAEASNSNGGGGGGVDYPRKEGGGDRDGDGDGDGDQDKYEFPRLFLRLGELLLGPGRRNAAALALGIPGALAWACVGPVCLSISDGLEVVFPRMFVGAVLLICVVITLLFRWL